MDSRATCLNCMDGRVQLPVINWIRDNYQVDFVDVITEAGMDGVLARQHDISEIIRSIKVSVDRNKSTKIFIVGHYDCRGNPTDEGTHRDEIRTATARIKTHWPKHAITGLWVNETWNVEIVSN